MGMFFQLIFWCGGICFAMVAFGKTINSASHVKSKGLACKNQIRVFFASDSWTRQMSGKNGPRYISQDQFFVAIMGKIVTTANGRGISCTFDQLSYMLTCCDEEKLYQLYSVDKREWTADSKLKLFRINIVFLFVNLFFFMLISGWGVHKLVSHTSRAQEDH